MSVSLIWEFLIFFFSAVQGILEFLPVSSSSHLALLYDWLAQIGVLPVGFISIDSLAIFSNMGTTLALAYCFRKDIFRICRSWRVFFDEWVVPSMPLLLAPFLKRYFIDQFANFTLIPYGMLVSSLFILGTSVMVKRGTQFSFSSPWLQRLWIGSLQLCACIPGISRSGWTISGGLLLGWDLKRALHTSFFLAIPAGCGATLYQVMKYFRGSVIQDGTESLVMLVLISGTLAIWSYGWCTRWIMSLGSIRPFGWYTLLLSLLLFFLVGISII